MCRFRSLCFLDLAGFSDRLLGFTLLVSLMSGLFFGLIPVIKYAGPRLALTLRGGGRTMSQGRERHRARNTLVVVQIALAMLLLVGSGLMIRTFQTLARNAARFHASGASAGFENVHPGTR